MVPIHPVLYSFPFSCALAVRLVLLQQGRPHDTRWVRRGPGRRATGAGLALHNPKQKVPTLVLEDGEVLTEVVSILAFLDAGAGRAAPERRRQLEWLSFIATELHQAVLGPLFDPSAPPAARTDAVERLLPGVLDHLDHTLQGSRTLLGGPPSPADAYLLWGLLLLRDHDASLLDARPALGRFLGARLAEPWVRAGLHEERRALAAAR